MGIHMPLKDQSETNDEWHRDGSKLSYFCTLAPGMYVTNRGIKKGTNNEPKGPDGS
jgi:hypothetical protein